MKMCEALVYVLFLLVCLSTASAISIAVPDDVVYDVYYLQSTIHGIPDIISQLDGYRAAIGFYPRASDKSVASKAKRILVEYHPIFSATSSLQSIANSKAQSLRFNDTATVSVTESFSEEKWIDRVHVYSATGEQVNKFLCWTPIYEKGNPNYQLLSVFSSNFTTGTPVVNEVSQLLHNRLLASSSNTEFIWSGFQILYSLGANNTKSIAARRSFVALLADPQSLQAANTTSIDERKNLIQFYSDYSSFISDALNKNLEWSSLQTYLQNVNSAHIYVHSKGIFYTLSKASISLYYGQFNVSIPNRQPEYHYERKRVRVDYSGKCGRFRPYVPSPQRLLTKEIIAVFSFIMCLVLLGMIIGAIGYCYRITIRRPKSETVKHSQITKKAPKDLREELLPDFLVETEDTL